MNIIVKYALTAFVVVLVSEIAKRSDKLGGLVASLPLITLLTLTWLYIEKQPLTTISNHAFYTFWYVLLTLPFFLLFPYLLAKIGFGSALAVSAIITLIFFYLCSLILNQFNIVLL